ncbi:MULTISPECIES: 4-hydroxy-3-methylbut-2-enyl diphosphate reductase [Butyrivibrio]|jgi:4-hydroxy-3-methylbut-2-enyl diphosphate reductase|uniref:4-hydroxy-3-methylbut-2-enyl diphosphate reductase n=1 Tax=Butyrivibrio fibrisolvens TaxID=831 RepID=A0A1H9ML96_BUTFI|nr:MULTISPECIES: 4-hydroxy-3-methylbut-2-enyl diphosphate reductase [Butyrivibrio]MBQ1459037.1 4-hydroxy-3-methylbut-2-enyl diphosphate reductase [Butyrivibrio sp.]SEP63528.1 4-hydroxy-3-methylbut-2-enyl diphosphate reductase [Butyrivibrio sp. TB]SER24388.1 4-hydroxy-3-methylbut-2-enyl diphosphate reductase [Butyrivibrio fibrisolvens]
MEVILAEHAGFCFGVKKAVDTVYEQVEHKDKKIYTYGPIIHNEEVVKDLESKGVEVVNNVDDLSNVSEDGTIVIRAHGIPRETEEKIKQKGISYVDATCPFVKRIHRIVDEESQKGRTIVITGNAKHPEVEGIVSWANGPVYVIESLEDAQKFALPVETELTLVSQTTFNYKKFKDVVEIFNGKGYNINIVNTICNATQERQTEAEKIAAEADAMIVIGGTSSSNTRKLYEICSGKCKHTYFVQTVDDLPKDFPEGIYKVGITAGASTPKNIIEEVQTYVRTGTDI